MYLYRSIDTVENQIVQVLRDSCLQQYIQTKKDDCVFETLSQLGQQLGFRTRYKTHPREWLWDLIWYEADDDNWTNFRGVYLVCEVEWFRNSLYHLEDFLKLTVADCEYRIFIFELADVTGDEETFQLLIEASEPFPNRKFLAIGFPPRNGDLIYRAWMHRR